MEINVGVSKNLNKVFTALVTPFLKGQVDFKSLENLVKFQLNKGIRGFVVNGTTAESPTLLKEEVREIFSLVKSLSPPDVTLVVGTGTNSTRESIEKTQLANAWGADAALVVVPYYNKPTDEGLYEHFKAIAGSSDLPIILYNVPGRTITSLAPETVARLSKLNSIVGIKEATGNLKLFAEMKALTPESFVYLSGDDASYLDFMRAGGEGVISVASHVYPELFLKVQSDFAKEQTAVEFKNYLESIQALFMVSNPIPVKEALYQMQIIASPELRLPLLAMNEEVRERFLKVFKRA